MRRWSPRAIKRMADEALAAMGRAFAAAYSPLGRPGIPPERLLEGLILLSLYTVRSERALCERITFDMLFRWFLDMTPDEACFDHSDFTNFRERLDALDITKKFSDRIVLMAFEAGLISEDHFSIDGSLLQSQASLKSLRHIEEIRRAARERERMDKDADGGLKMLDRAFQTSQRKRRLDEEIFGWLKGFGGLRRARVAGRWKIQQLADLALTTLNLVRMSTLLA